MYSIYCITLPNGKQYVGQTATIKRRFHQHRTSARTGHAKTMKNFYDDWRRFGIDTAVFKELETVETKEKALEREYYWINALNTVENGYNIVNSNPYVKKSREKSKKPKYKCKVIFPDGNEIVYKNFNVAGKILKTESQVLRKIASKNEPYVPIHIANGHLRGIIVERICCKNGIKRPKNHG